MALKIISLAIVTQRTGLSRSTIWRLERRREFVPKIQLSPGRIGYLEHLVEQWISEKCRVAFQSEIIPVNTTNLISGESNSPNKKRVRAL